MSSDPIEVLREAVTALKTMHGPFDHDYIKDEKCCDRCRLLVRAESALASLSAPKRQQGNTPIGELLAQYEEEGCDHSNMEWVRAAAQRYVETMEDSQVRCLLHVLSAPKGDLTVEELVDMLGGIVYWSGLGEVCIGMHPDAKATGELEAAVTMLNARMSAPKPEGEVVVTRDESGAIVAVTRQDAEGRTLSVIAEAAPKHKAGDNMEAGAGHVQGKPESAEAVAWHTEDHLTDKSATTYDPAVRDRWIAKGWPVTPLYTAPPRPEASAPVGVEGLVERMRHAPSRLWRADLVGQQISVERMRDILAFALAQQPAACDGTCYRSPSGLCETHEAEAHAYLAGQQQGGTPE